MSAKFSPSLMCMDLTQFKEQITAMNKKADFYHVDIMDGNYVRNITLSPFFIENLKKISDVKCPKTRAYIVIITERKAIDIIRSRSKLVDMEFWESTYGIEIPLPGDHGLADAMARLPAAYRDILLLRYYNGYSVREISSMLHIKKDTAQKQLWRAKAALQKHLKGDA